MPLIIQFHVNVKDAKTDKEKQILLEKNFLKKRGQILHVTLLYVEFSGFKLNFWFIPRLVK